MTRVSKSVDLQRPAEYVYDYLADFTHTAEWDPGVVSASRLDDGPVGVGSRFELVAEFRGRHVPITYEIEIFERPLHLVLVGRGKAFTGIDDVTVHSTDEGSTVDWNVDFRMRGLLRIAEPLLKGVFEKISEEAMAGLVSTLGTDTGV